MAVDIMALVKPGTYGPRCVLVNGTLFAEDPEIQRNILRTERYQTRSYFNKVSFSFTQASYIFIWNTSANNYFYREILNKYFSKQVVIHAVFNNWIPCWCLPLTCEKGLYSELERFNDWVQISTGLCQMSYRVSLRFVTFGGCSSHLAWEIQ